MRIQGLSGLRDWNRERKYQSYLAARSRGWLSPCDICWTDPDAYAKAGHVCDASRLRNHSTNASPASAAVVAFRAKQASPMTDKELTSHLNRKVHVYGGFRWR